MPNNTIAAQLKRLNGATKTITKDKKEKVEKKEKIDALRVKEAKELIRIHNVTKADGSPLDVGKVSARDLKFLKNHIDCVTPKKTTTVTPSSPPQKPVKKGGKKRNPDNIFSNLSQDLCPKD